MAKAAPTKAKETGQTQDVDPVLDRLDTLITLLLPRMKGYSEGVSDVQRQILALCDYEHTSADICGETKKSAKHVNKELSLLRSRGMVKTVKRDGRLVYVRL